ncbi:gp436 family protein [Cupriavidus metallidurans]|nr:DUF1320 domain-containing protein [Cupriavidus metallidurans]
MDYLTRADLDGYVPPSIQAQLTDDDAGTVVNESRLAEAISTASEVADGYLRQRYRLPLLVVPKQLKDWVGAIARHWLYMRRPEGANDLPPAVVRSYKDAVMFLGQVRDEKLSIGIVDADGAEPGKDSQPAPASGGAIQLRASRREFSDDVLGRY